MRSLQQLKNMTRHHIMGSGGVGLDPVEEESEEMRVDGDFSSCNFEYELNTAAGSDEGGNARRVPAAAVVAESHAGALPPDDFELVRLSEAIERQRRIQKNKQAALEKRKRTQQNEIVTHTKISRSNQFHVSLSTQQRIQRNKQKALEKRRKLLHQHCHGDTSDPSLERKPVGFTRLSPSMQQRVLQNKLNAVERRRKLLHRQQIGGVHENVSVARPVSITLEMKQRIRRNKEAAEEKRKRKYRGPTY